MASFNKVILMGNLTRDPDLRQTNNGTGVCSLDLAVNRRWRDASGNEQDEVCFVSVSAWGKSAENCAQYLVKGSPVMIEGHLKLDQWEDRQTGEKRSKLSVVAENVRFLAARQNDGGQQQPQNQYQQGDGYRQQGGFRNQGARNNPPPQQLLPYPPEDGPGYEDEIPF